MYLTKDQIAALVAPLGAHRVKSRKQAGRDLSYLESWDVKAALIRVFGFGGFSAEVIENKIVSQETYMGGRDKNTEMHRVSAMSTVRLTIHGKAQDGEVATDPVYTETAIGSASLPDIGEAFDMAQKTASSDALKRCAIYLGTQFGLSLYNDGSVQDVVRVVVEPCQAALLKEVHEEQQARWEEAQAKVAAATGGGE